MGIPKARELLKKYAYLGTKFKKLAKIPKNILIYN